MLDPGYQYILYTTSYEEHNILLFWYKWKIDKERGSVYNSNKKVTWKEKYKNTKEIGRDEQRAKTKTREAVSH